MRNPIFRLSWILLLLVSVSTGCRKTDLGADSQEIAESNSPNRLVRISLEGKVINANNEPVSGAIVRSGTSVAQTDINGQFSFPSLMVYPNAAFVEIQKTNFFREFRSLDVLADSKQFLEVELLQQEQFQAFNATGGAVIETKSGASVTIPQNALIEKANGSTFSGEARIDIASVNSNESSFFNLLPAIKGINKDKKQVVIIPVGMIKTELTGSTGQLLEPAIGKPAQLRFAIPATIAGSADGPLTLWHYNESIGQWTEEGVAVKTGDFYTAQVTQFSTWALAGSKSSVTVKAEIIDEDNNAIPFALVQLFSENGIKALSHKVRTDENGMLSIPAISNMGMELRVTNDCGEMLLSKRINTSTTGISLGKLQTAHKAPAIVNISGSVTNCKAAPVFKGHVRLKIDGKLVKAPITNGSFLLSVKRCNNSNTTATLVAVDEEGNYESGPLNIAVNEGNYETGNISTCKKNSLQYISYIINGTNYLLQAPSDSLVHIKDPLQNKNNILCYKTNDNTTVAFSFSFSGSETPGEYPVTALKVIQEKSQLQPAGTFTVKISNYGNSGQFIEGSCSGKIKDLSTNKILPFSFQFKVLRNQ